MGDLKRLETVARKCRFGTPVATLRRLLPGIENEIPHLSKIGTADEIIGEGFPVAPNHDLDRELAKLVTRLIDQHLDDPHHREDLTSPDAEQRLFGERYVEALSDLLVKAVSGGGIFKFENVVWLLLSERIATALNTHAHLNHLIGRDPARYGRIKRLVLASLATRHRLANASLRHVFHRTKPGPWTERVFANPLLKMLTENRLIDSERPDSLYHRPNLRSVFLVKDYGIDPDSFLKLFDVVEQTLRRDYDDLEHGRPTSRALFLQESFLRDGPPPAAREDWAHRLAHREDVSRYVLFHLAGADYPRELKRELTSLARLRELARAFAVVTNDLLVWDFLNALRSLIREVRIEENGTYLHDIVLSERTVPITLDRDHLYNHNRWGTYVLFDIIGFSRRTREVLNEYAGLAIQNLFAIRRDRLSEFDGRPESFEGDAVFESFERAIDAVRYVSVFQDHYESQRVIKRRVLDSPMESPFVDGIRVGIGTGESALISIYQGTALDGMPREEFRRIGQVINLTSRLTTGKAGEKYLQGPNPSREPDPLRLFRACIDHEGTLDNNGIVSLDSTFQELRDQVRAENLPRYDPEETRDAKSPFQHYSFLLIYKDPTIDRMVLVREIPHQPVFKGFENQRVRCYEYLILTEAEYRQLRGRDQGLKRVVPASASQRPVVQLGGDGVTPPRSLVAGSRARG